MMQGFVGDIKGVVVLDNEGKRIIGKYYNAVGSTLEGNTNQKAFERQLFFKSNKQTAGKSGSAPVTQAYENDIMIVENYVAVFRCYSDMTIYILGHSDDNELILGSALDCVHDCFDNIFKH